MFLPWSRHDLTSHDLRLLLGRREERGRISDWSDVVTPSMNTKVEYMCPLFHCFLFKTTVDILSSIYFRSQTYKKVDINSYGSTTQSVKITRSLYTFIVLSRISSCKLEK